LECGADNGWRPVGQRTDGRAACPGTTDLQNYQWGKGPTVAQHVPAQLTFRVTGNRKVYALAPNGARAKQVAATLQNDQLTFAAQASDATLLYEMTME